MGWRRVRNEKKRLKKLDFGSNRYIVPVYFDTEKNRYIRVWYKSKKDERRCDNKKVRKMKLDFCPDRGLYKKLVYLGYWD